MTVQLLKNFKRKAGNKLSYLLMLVLMRPLLVVHQLLKLMWLMTLLLLVA